MTASTLLQTADGGYLLTAASTPIGSTPAYDIDLIKMNAEGLLQWRQNHGNARDEFPVSVTIGRAGRVRGYRLPGGEPRIPPKL